MPDSFDIETWTWRCEELASQAARLSGASDYLFARHFSSTVDAELRAVPAALKPQALEVARNWGYRTAAELNQEALEAADSGACAHGIDVNCCPVGCGG